MDQGQRRTTADRWAIRVPGGPQIAARRRDAQVADQPAGPWPGVPKTGQHHVDGLARRPGPPFGFVAIEAEHDASGAEQGFSFAVADRRRVPGPRTLAPAGVPPRRAAVGTVVEVKDGGPQVGQNPTGHGVGQREKVGHHDAVQKGQVAVPVGVPW